MSDDVTKVLEKAFANMGAGFDLGLKEGIREVASWLSNPKMGYLATVHEDALWVWCLSHNLFIAAVACYSWDLGAYAGFGAIEVDENDILHLRDDDWSPGCGYPAPREDL